MNVANQEAKVRARLDSADLVHVSFPKSGRTWVRWFLQTYYCHAGVAFDLPSPMIPATEDLSSIVFTEDYFDVYADVPGDPYVLFSDIFDRKRVVVLVRDPRDVVVSYFHWAAHRLIDRDRRPHLDVTSLHGFIKSPVYGITRIARYTSELLDYASQREGVLLLQYEALREDPAGQFERLVKFVSLSGSVDAQAFRDALDSAEFNSMQQKEIAVTEGDEVARFERIGVRNWTGDRNALKVRRGTPGGFRGEMSVADRARCVLDPTVRTTLKRMKLPRW